MEHNFARRVLQLVLLFSISSCCIKCMKTTFPYPVKEVSLPIRETPCYSFMVNISLSNAMKERTASNTLRCYDNEGMRKRKRTDKKGEKYILKFSNVQLPNMTELLKLAELRIYIPLALVMELRHRLSGHSVSCTELHTVTAARLGWQIFNVTSVFKLVQGSSTSLHTRVILRNFTAPSSQKRGAIWREEKPMLFISTEENNIDLANLMTTTTNLTETRKRMVRSASPKACQKTPFSWSVTSTDLEPVVGSKDMIISPTSVSLDYCSGNCKHSFLVNIHSALQANFVKKPRLTLPGALGQGAQPDHLPWLPFPCCIPVKYAPLKILYMDRNSNLVYKTLPDAIATECGCR